MIPAPSLRVWCWASCATSLCPGLLYEVAMTVSSSPCCLRTKWLKIWKPCSAGYAQVWLTLLLSPSQFLLWRPCRTGQNVLPFWGSNYSKHWASSWSLSCGCSTALPRQGKYNSVFWGGGGRKRTASSLVSMDLPNFSMPLYKEAESWVTKCEWKLFPAL